MKQIQTMIIALIAMVAISTSVHAGSFGFGVTGALMNVEASGTETEGTAAETGSKSASAGNNAYIGSIFAEYTFDGMAGMTVGLDYIPGSADVNAKTQQRTDTVTSVSGTETTTSLTEVRKANASVENHITYYAELPIHSSGLFFKLGYVEMDVNSDESGGSNAGSYGNKTVDGTTVGLGIKQEVSDSLFIKVLAQRTEFDGFTLTETGQSADSVVNSIKVDGIETSKASLAIGYKF